MFTEGGETPECIANRYLGYNDASKSQQIREANTGSFAWEMMNGSGIYSRNRALWFPIEGEQSSPENQAAIVHKFDWLTYDQRDMLRQLQTNNVNIHHVANAHEATRFANIMMATGAFAGESIHSGLEIGSKAREGLADALKQAKAKLISMAEASSEEIAQKATQEFKTIYQHVASQYTGYLKELNTVERYTLERPWAVIRGLRKHGWYIDDLFTVDRLTKMVKFLKWTKVGGYLGLAIEGGIDTYEIWEHTHNWEKTLKAASMAIADAALGVLAVDGAFALLVVAGVTSPEWGTCLIVGAAAMGGASAIEESILNPVIEKA